MNSQSQVFKINKIVSLLILISIILLGNINVNMVNTVSAATNLIKAGTFEGDVHLNWETWQTNGTIDFFRSYETAINQGSYSAGIEIKSDSTDRFSVGVTGNSKNIFRVDGTKQYNLQFYAKASAAASVGFYLQNASTFAPMTNVVDQSVTTGWNKYNVLFTPLSGDVANSVLAMAVGGNPTGTIINIDSLNLFENNIKLTTTEIKGSIGDKNKSLKFNTALPFSEQELSIELPFFYSETRSVGVKRFHPDDVINNSANFTLPEGTFGGVGTVYINDTAVGKFTYNIATKINEFFPSLVRADEDFTVEGSGFSPIDETTFIVVKVIDVKGKVSELWIKPNFIDSKLRFVTGKMPAGLVNGDVYVVSNFKDMNNKDIQSKSNRLKYGVMPVIFYTQWSNRGYEHVGDKLKIFGLGIAQNPSVNFYGDSNNLIISKKAKLISIVTGSTTIETIEVETPVNSSQLILTVKVNGVESEISTGLTYSAKAKISKIVTKATRTSQETNEKIPASKIGEEITITGEGFNNQNSATYVEFQRLDERTRFVASSSDITADGKQLKITVPAGTQTGFISVETNGQKSNFLPLEIIPTIVDYWPNPVVPGFPMTINVNGVGNNLNLVKVYFVSDNQETAVNADSMETFVANTLIHVTPPLALSSNYNKIVVQYDKWRDDNQAVINVLPHITGASIDLDTKILIIKGYGFSIVPKENVITFKNADAEMTLANPQTKSLGVFPTEEGQEIRIQILDNYYYGNVSVKVGDNVSNEANFGPVSVRKIARRVEYVRSLDRVMGVLYISGNNFGSQGGVKVGEVWADVHYRSNFFIIAVVEQANINDNPVIVARQ